MLALFLIAVCIGCFCDVVKYHREGWNLLHLSPYIIIGGLSGWWGIKFWIYAIFIRGEDMKSYEERQITEKYDLVIYNPFSIVYERLTKEEADAKLRTIQDLAIGSNKPNLLVSWKLLDKDGNHIALEGEL